MSHRCQKLSPLLQNDWITGAQQDKHDKHVKGAEEGQGSPVGPNAIQRTVDKNEKVESLSRGEKYINWLSNKRWTVLKTYTKVTVD